MVSTLYNKDVNASVTTLNSLKYQNKKKIVVN